MVIYIVEVHVPDRDPTNNLHGTIILVKLRLNFDNAGTSSAMTRVLVFEC